MGYDDGDVTPRGCVMVPAELVEAVFEASLTAMREWHEDNDFPMEHLVCAAAMNIVEKMFHDLTADMSGGATIQ